MLTLNIFIIRWRIVQTWELWMKKKRTFLFFDLVTWLLDWSIWLLIYWLMYFIVTSLSPRKWFLWIDLFYLIATTRLFCPRLFLCNFILFHGYYDKTYFLLLWGKNDFLVAGWKVFSVMENSPYGLLWWKAETFYIVKK